jgi:hypothetical protein
MRDVGSPPDAPLRLPAAAASLRIYEPIEAFPADRRAALLAAARDPLVRGRGASIAVVERAASVRAAAALPPRLTDDVDVLGSGAPADPTSESAWFLLDPPSADGQPRLAPAQLRWRALLALEEFRRSIPAPMLQIFVPGVVHEAAARDLTAVSQQAVHSRPHSMVSPWQVPLGWLCAFAPGDRLLGSGGDHSEARQAALPATGQAVPTTDTGLRYRASMADARRSLARALGAIRKTPVEWMAASDVEYVGRWLEEFHPRSVVELDYGSLRPPAGTESDAGPDAETTPVADPHSHSRLPTPSLDTSVEEMAAAMDALKAGRSDAAAEIVTNLITRWDAVRALEHAS